MALLFALACGDASQNINATSVREILNGVPDEGCGVVSLLGGACVGTVIDPRMILTAAHCLPAPGGREVDVIFASDRSVIALDYLAHPRWDQKRPTVWNDIGLILIPTAPVDSCIWPLSDRAFEVSSIGREVELVGHESETTTASIPLAKIRGRAVITAYSEGDFRIEAAPSLTCRGDSGGPAFLDGRVAGVATAGERSCEMYSRHTRVDVHLDSFLRPYLHATTEGRAALGQRCFYDAHCMSGRCIEASPLSYCTESCEKDGECPAPMTCVDSLCRHQQFELATTGSACLLDIDCASGICAEVDDVRACRELCAPGMTSCSGDQTCIALANRGDLEICVPPDVAGACACRETRTGRTLHFVLILIALSIMRRRWVR